MASLEIPKKHKAMVYDKPGLLSTKLEEVDTPEPGPGEVLVHLTHSGVCHSDYAVMTNGVSVMPFSICLCFRGLLANLDNQISGAGCPNQLKRIKSEAMRVLAQS